MSLLPSLSLTPSCAGGFSFWDFRWALIRSWALVEDPGSDLSVGGGVFLGGVFMSKDIREGMVLLSPSKETFFLFLSRDEDLPGGGLRFEGLRVLRCYGFKAFGVEGFRALRL